MENCGQTFKKCLFIFPLEEAEFYSISPKTAGSRVHPTQPALSTGNLSVTEISSQGHQVVRPKYCATRKKKRFQRPTNDQSELLSGQE